MQQQTLFTMPQPTQPTPLQKRHKAMKAVARKAGEPFQAAFYLFVPEFLKMHGPSTGEEIRAAYERTTLPKPHKWQAAGAVYTKLRADEKIVEVGKRKSKKFGNDLAVIDLAK